MNPVIVEFLDKAAAWHAPWWLLSSAVVLILIDMFFPTDWPARLAYFLAAAGMFFLINLSVLASLIVAIAIWIGLELLHHFWWGKYLKNAPAPDMNQPS